MSLLIRGATMIDGLGHEPKRADVLVKDGKIAAVGTVAGSGAEEIAAKPAVAVRYAKRAFDLTEELPLAEGYARECELTAELREHPEAVAAGRAYMQRIAGR